MDSFNTPERIRSEQANTASHVERPRQNIRVVFDQHESPTSVAGVDEHVENIGDVVRRLF
jgi:hypothetical protein